MEITDYHAKYFAHELTRRCASDEIDKLAPVLADAQVDLNPHQVEAALFAFRNPLGKGALLADEVGLGKTIEAALLLAQKWAEGKRKLLVILPANLRKQWSQELEEKFHLPTAILETRTFNEAVRNRNFNPFHQPAVVLCSFQFARNKAAYVEQTDWDLVVVDEAHRLRNVYKPGNKIAQAIKEAIAPFPKVLLTATPLQNSLLELYGLVSILDEYAFGDLDSFRDRFARPAGDDFTELKQRLAPLCKRTLRRQVLQYVRYTNRLALVQEFVPFPTEEELYDRVSEYLRGERLYALPASQRQLVTLILRKLLASSTYAIAGTLAGLVAKLEAAERAAQPVTDVPPELPADVEGVDELSDEWDGDDPSDPTRPPLSPAEIQELRREMAQLRELAALANSIPENSKGTKLLEALRRGFEAAAAAQGPASATLQQKAVIFTESRKTQDYLLRLLDQTEFRGQALLFNGTNTDPLSKQILLRWQQRHAGTDRITGSPSADMRAALVECFRDERKILIATEAAAEGINLQFCNLVVNYDLPWNPQRIEQRIGRCHRYGQKYDVVVVNFLNKKNAADQRVYQLLEQKFKLFDGVFGASDEVLGTIESGVDFEKRIAAIYQQCRTPEQIDFEFDKLQREMEADIEAGQRDAREKLLDNFDPDVVERVKIETKDALDRYQERLWELTKHMLRQHANFDDVERCFTLQQNPFPDATIHPGPYRMGRHTTEANTYRPSHPLAERVLAQTRSMATPSHEVTFGYTGSRKKIAALEPFVGTSGWLRCVLLKARGLEQEDHMLFAVVDATGKVLDAHAMRRLFDLPARVGAPVTLADGSGLAAALAAERKAVLQRQTERSSKWFDAEVDKLDRWATDRRATLEGELKKLEQSLKDLKREERQAGTLQDKLDIRRRIKAVDGKRDEAFKLYESAKADLDKQQDLMLDDIARRLKQATESEELFTIRWTLA